MSGKIRYLHFGQISKCNAIPLVIVKIKELRIIHFVTLDSKYFSREYSPLTSDGAPRY